MSDRLRASFVLPFPPGANNLFAGKGRRRKAPKYVTWIRTAGLELMAQRPRKFTEPVTIGISLYRPDDRRRDVDGMAKAIIDLLVRHAIIPDDSWRHLHALSIEWAGLDREAPRALVTVEPCGEESGRS